MKIKTSIKVANKTRKMKQPKQCIPTMNVKTINYKPFGEKK